MAHLVNQRTSQAISRCQNLVAQLQHTLFLAILATVIASSCCVQQLFIPLEGDISQLAIEDFFVVQLAELISELGLLVLVVVAIVECVGITQLLTL